MKKAILLLMVLFNLAQILQAQEDKYQWLEDIDGAKSSAFVNDQNKATLDVLTQQKDYPPLYNKFLDIFNSPERIAYPAIRGKYVYNFWKDTDHPRGIWRRCLLSDYSSGHMNWETLLDIDEMSRKDNIKWVYKGASGSYPDYNRFLVQLSNGGGDAVVIKEFDPEKKEFVKDGFSLDEAKGYAVFADENTVLVGTNFGAGTITTSGYPRQAKIWKRGTPLKDARLLFEGDPTDVQVVANMIYDDTRRYISVNQRMSGTTGKVFLLINDKLAQLDIPEDCSVNNYIEDQLILTVKSDWTLKGKTYKSGTLLGLDLTELLKGNQVIQSIFTPDVYSSISGVSATKTKLLVNILNNVTNQLFVYTYTKGKWNSEKVKAPAFGTLGVTSSDDFSEKYFFQFTNFLTPTTLYSADAGSNTFNAVKSLPSFFDAGKYQIKQFKAVSKDGTLVPYFMVCSKNIKADGSNPTIISAYGGFEISSLPFYLATFGTAWLDKGGTFVLANIRGGGEYGPQWHKDGMKEKRQNVFDDLYAVSEDMIAKKYTSPKHLGIVGGSNGGLLVAVAFTQRPDLYNAVCCQVPLLDMQRYTKLSAGASWIAEYGNPEIAEEWEYIKKYSPYQNLVGNKKYPEVLFTTSTRDDRVHPGHARKMVAKMNDMGYKTYFYENTEGGHGGSSTNEQLSKVTALAFSYMLMKLK